MAEDADESYNLSRIESSIQEKVLTDQKKAVALSIQMGFVNDKSDKPLSVAYVTSTDSTHFQDVQWKVRGLKKETA